MEEGSDHFQRSNEISSQVIAFHQSLTGQCQYQDGLLAIDSVIAAIITVAAAGVGIAATRVTRINLRIITSESGEYVFSLHACEVQNLVIGGTAFCVVEGYQSHSHY